MQKIVVRKDLYDEIMNKAGLPTGTISGNYKKVADNPSKWEYVTQEQILKNESGNDRRAYLANKAPLIIDVQELSATEKNYKAVGTAYLLKMRNEVFTRNVICKENNKKVSDVDVKHIFKDKNTDENRTLRVRALPFVLPIIEKYGKRGIITKRPAGTFTEIVGKADITMKNGAKKRCAIAVILVTDKKNRQSLKQLSVFVVNNKVIKSLATDAPRMGRLVRSGLKNPCASNSHFSTHNSNIPQSAKKSTVKPDYNGEDMLHKSFDITVADITEKNKQKKIVVRKGLYDEIMGKMKTEDIEKSRLPKYIQKIQDGKGGCKYIYEKTEKQAVKKVDFCTTPLLNCNIKNAKTLGEKYIINWGKKWKNGHKCESLNGMKVVLDTAYKPKLKRYGISVYHLSHKGMKTGRKLRKPIEIYSRARLLPVAEEILTDKKKGIVTEVRQEGNKVEYSVCGKVKINNKVQIVCVVVSKLKPANSVYISIINKAMPDESDIAVISDVYLVDPITLTNQQRLDLGLSGLSNHFDKAVEASSTKGTSGKLRSSISDSLPKHSLNISQSVKKSTVKPDYNGEDMLHKSFDITVADITEKNKQKKIEQVEKALTAIYQKQPFAIRHIKADRDSARYDDIVLRIRGFDRDKIQKAVHKMAFSLDASIKSAKGEAFTYKAQEELTDRIVSELTEKTKSLYSFLISFLGLPEVRIVSKANLTYKGKILYDPESGKPISKAEWKKFTAELEKFLNRNYSGTGKKIVLSTESLGRILERLSKTNSFEALKKMRLSGLKYSGKTFDWISDDIRNMQNALGESIDRMTQARIQVAVDSAAQRVTKVTDAIRNDIQQTIIDGIKNRQSKAKISQNLFDKCSGLNRDFQRIADTEIQNNTNNAYIKEEVYNTPGNEKVYFKRFEVKDDNTCKKCRAIAGKIALFSDIPLDSERIKDPYADYAIWEGKTDGAMPTGTVHPYCRGGWYRYYPDIK